MRNALNKVNAVQPKVNQAIALLQPKENNSALVHAKNQLQNAVNESDPTRGMTSTTANNYNTKKREAQAEIQKADQIIADGDATAKQISDEK